MKIKNNLKLCFGDIGMILTIMSFIMLLSIIVVGSFFIHWILGLIVLSLLGISAGIVISDL